LEAAEGRIQVLVEQGRNAMRVVDLDVEASTDDN
jgi:exodeoxyribonuclease VII small subunit